MILEFKKSDVSIIPFKNNNVKINDTLIVEALGSFSEQHNLASELANIVYSNYLNGILKRSSMISTFW